MGRLLWGPWLSVALCVLALPADAQSESVADDPADAEPLCIILYEPSADFSRLFLAVDLLLDERQMEAWANDADGDGDGRTTAWEVKQFENSRAASFDGNDGLGRWAMWLDLADPKSVTKSITLTGFEGETAGERERAVQEQYVYRFDAERLPNHRITGGGESGPFVAIEYVIVQAPKGWLVESLNGEPHNATIVERPSFNTWESYSMDFVRVDEERPSPPAAMATLALVLAVATRFQRAAMSRRP